MRALNPPCGLRGPESERAQRTQASGGWSWREGSSSDRSAEPGFLRLLPDRSWGSWGARGQRRLLKDPAAESLVAGGWTVVRTRWSGWTSADERGWAPRPEAPRKTRGSSWEPEGASGVAGALERFNAGAMLEEPSPGSLFPAHPPPLPKDDSLSSPKEWEMAGSGPLPTGYSVSLILLIYYIVDSVPIVELPGGVRGPNRLLPP